MHIFVINLPEDSIRRDAIEQQLCSFNLTYEIFPAVKGKSLTPVERALHYDELWYIRNEGRPASLGELGCALSHLEIYKLIIKRNIPYALILEDDAWLNPNLPQLLLAIEQKYDSQQKDIFLLTWFQAISLKKFETLWAAYHVADVRSALCSHGYVVSNAAAGALVNALYPVKHVPDCWGWLQRHRIVKIRAVFPTCITANMTYVSNITPDYSGLSTRRSYTKQLMRKFYRAFWLTYDHAMALKQRMG